MSQTEFMFHACKWGNCQSEFAEVESLANHINEHHLANLTVMTCQWDGCVRQTQPFSTKMKLIMHVRGHTGEKPYSCALPNCGKKFSRMDILSKHLKSHVAANPYVCISHGCGMVFENEEELAKHKETHPVVKPYSCSQPGCNKRYLYYYY